MIIVNPSYQNHVMKSETEWLVIEASDIKMAKQAIRIGKRCKVPKCRITVKGYTGQIEKYATVKLKS